eukprot:TRINITY_DN39244_c0_g1_i1.p1 TRINITY_DN39244_c0_g1~~TRINITY_DN39244_c0_g1_i1.p1  ORF type:complete len:897 (+),score=130.49 TRINITY_DN39244_c0_g1_i1:40-2691(+)
MWQCFTGGSAAGSIQSREVSVQLQSSPSAHIPRRDDSYNYQPLLSLSPRADAFIAKERPKVDIIQFVTPIFVAQEGELFRIQLMRLGSLDGRVSCSFRTEDSSGKAGVRYQATSGKVVFEDGEASQTISVQILEASSWSAVLEFKVVLCDPIACELGRVLKVCRIKVVDADPFPSARFREALVEGPKGIKSIPGVSLFWAYLTLMLEQQGNSWRMCVTLLFDQLKNAYVYYMLISSVYMVNVIFGHEEGAEDELVVEDDPKQTARLLGLSYILLPILLHFWKVAKAKMDLQGRCRTFLQTSLIRKYLNYSDDSRREVSQAELLNFVMQDADKLAGGVNEVSAMVETFLESIMLTYFAVSSDPQMAPVVVALPVLMVLWSCFRDGLLTKPADPDEQQGLVQNLIVELSSHYRLIASYFQRPAINEKFQARAVALRETELPMAMFEITNEFFLDMLGPLCVGGYIALFSPQVISKEMPLGTFLATISVFKQVTSNFVTGYKGFKRVHACFKPLVSFTIFLNRETGLLAMKDVVQHRTKQTEQERKKCFMAEGTASQYRTDLIPIKLENVGYLIKPKGDWLFGSINLSTPQGYLVAVTGRHGSGKTKLMKILCGEVLPTVGSVFMPSHLRCLMVSHQVSILKSSPLQNLLFGCACTADDDDAKEERVLEILDRLRMTKTLELVKLEFSILHQDSDDEEDDIFQVCCCQCTCTCGRPGRATSFPRKSFFPKEGSARAERIAESLDSWQDALSYQECAKLHIARALVTNPEILVLEKPLLNFDSEEADIVMQAVSDHVRDRGLCLDPAGKNERRPRTCFYSAERISEHCSPDVVWKFSQDEGINESLLQSPSQRSLKSGRFSTLTQHTARPQGSPNGFGYSQQEENHA